MTIVAAPNEAGVAPAGSVASLSGRFEAVRRQTEALCLPLETEDYVVRSMPDASPTKWHLAHTSWFFETFVLVPHCSWYTPLDPAYAYLFNSYYVQAGERHCRAQRGLVTRPTVQQIYVYRAYVDAHMRRLLEEIDGRDTHPALSLIELGLHHEQQHQELILTDLKHLFWTNPIKPSYHARAGASGTDTSSEVPELRWRGVDAGLHRVGHEGEGFSFDNEGPAHQVYLNDYRLASRLVTNGEYLAFIEAGGYRNPTLWLDSGWAAVRERGWEAPLYWSRVDGEWMEFTLAGERRLDRAEPVCHVSYYEADAFARWTGCRLPTEAEWEVAAAAPMTGGGFAASAALHSTALSDARGAGGGRENADAAPSQLYGDVWQWTQSPYVAYPGYVATKDAIGEYNGKWMCDQWVLRGASCVTPPSHARRTYRNFFAADTRWQFSGIRLARDGG